LQITFDTATATPREVAALVALLTSVCAAPFADASPARLVADDSEATQKLQAAVVPPAPAPVDDVTAAFGPADPPEPVQSAGGPVDADGLPWDVRIHATTADGGGSRTADGRWRKKRGVADALVQTVTAELRAALPASPICAADTVDISDICAAEGGDVVVPPEPPPAPAPAAVHPPIVLFQALMKKVTPLQNAGKLTVLDITGMCETVGVKKLGDLLQRPDLIPVVEAQVDAIAAA